METIHRVLRYASDLYDAVDFNHPELLINQPAPEPIFAVILAVINLTGVIFAFQNRLRKILRNLKENYEVKDAVWGSIFSRMFLSALLDTSDVNFTSCYYFTIGFIFLAGYQINFNLTYHVLLLVFGLVALFDLLRIYLSYRRYESLRDYVVTTKTARKEMVFDDRSEVNQAIVTITPGNIYQNMTRMILMVIIVFVAQACLISILVWDTLTNQKTTTCFIDGAQDCPTTGTVGSYILYIFGMFIQCVLILAAKGTHYEHTEQTNPNFWVAVFLGTKKVRSDFSWEGARGLAILKTQDIEITAGRNILFFRLLLTTLVNSYGYRVLYNSLPILLASRSSYAVVIFAPISILYISHLDEAHHSHKFNMVEAPIEDEMTTGTKTVDAPLELTSIGLILNSVYSEKKQ
eukprot:CAMPEP_0194199912 /NCGR_PEP_ID=MMETSP0156-20130528/747_1 /TAXON_ID=33649 /ORGANISM="Thalassionema nitzschioides, Strain L26-B" /LENGTH=404 /DNA_ID=CAMNT_0038924863 /DNA_START=59 /DNA_END=1273 /DNA_ORIENTATION=+